MAAPRGPADTGFPVRDARGNALLGFAPTPPDPRPGAPPLPLALLVAAAPGGVVMVFDRYRAQWELPGGGIEPGETPEQAARREFAEETAQCAAQVRYAGVAEFTVAPGRRERGAVFCGTCVFAPERFVPTAEIAAVRLWPIGTALPGISPIDARIAALAAGTIGFGPAGTG
ncbi:NUDIX hydrolase [Streptomonospora nanhaiensis]|uniref:ADP-ribose pyrophosphatase YjhB (NUDIX family) n=1 Tax=Streptomonospora nanhaiensis TaxID=1323731 RepID=A0A853BSV2_9ACTN|nr:NUDIX hydrolase [Streptomonospora nanhaiensis]MBV2366564.1 NUDIX hydrolase [Streptomonospora nanhaiensis]MBX9386906.1 NUDIX hydrolase [Streptomonospora nanhaiensis]NYI98223.1 ADP-ribose pyrophosphatase YjhB (NUDIX family) [Streptomonospora nanhaiensis]